MGSSWEGSSRHPAAPPPAAATAGVAPLRGTGWKAMGDRQPLGSLRLGLQ